MVTRLNSLIYLRLAAKTLVETIRLTGSVFSAARALRPLIREKRSDPRYGNALNHRMVDGKRFWHPHIPGYPSPAFDRVFHHWLSHNLGLTPYHGLYSANMAITNRCGLHCEHCFEACSSSEKEHREQDVLDSIEQVVSLGATRITLSGGEPAERLPLVFSILETFRHRGVQFWINTSAHGLKSESINSLKTAGLTGIAFSLDHHLASEHDRFRGRTGCHQRVLACARRATQEGLVVELSLCATNTFVSEANLSAYLELAMELGATFVQIVEPKPLGRYSGKEVALTRENRDLLEAFYARHANAATGPLVGYIDHHNRTQGCEGGRFHVYVDAAGAAHPCPFCQSIATPLHELTPSNLEKTLSCPQSV